MAMTGITASFRFPGSTHHSLRHFATTLVPLPRLHFLIPAYAPLTARSVQPYRALNVPELVPEVAGSTRNTWSIIMKFWRLSVLTQCWPRAMSKEGVILPRQCFCEVASRPQKSSTTLIWHIQREALSTIDGCLMIFRSASVMCRQEVCRWVLLF